MFQSLSGSMSGEQIFPFINTSFVHTISLTNVSGDVVTINLQIVKSGLDEVTEIAISPKNMELDIDNAYVDTNRVLMRGDGLKVITSALVHFHISFEEKQ